MYNLIQKLKWKCKGSRIKGQNNPREEENVGDYMLPNFETHHKVNSPLDSVILV